MHRNRSVDVHQFAMVPRAEIPRSSFRMQRAYKTTFDGGYLVPVFCEEVLPGDTFRVSATMFGRLATPLFPVLDNLYLDSFWFFCPNRLVWNNWVKFMGEQVNPADSISFVVPQQVSPAGGYAINSLQDYFGLPTVGQVAGGATVSHSALPLRVYNLTWNTWFRDENLQNSATVDLGDGPDTVANYVLKRRGKRHDYFTSALPWPQKGSTAVTLPLGTVAPVKGLSIQTTTAAAAGVASWETDGATSITYPFQWSASAQPFVKAEAAGVPSASNTPQIYADLSAATAATINQLRQSFQIQKLLERDARGGTRYQEIVNAHFGVNTPLPLYRPQYLGGGSSPIGIRPVTQNTQTGITGGSTPMGSLAAYGEVLAGGHGFTQSFVEHGYVIGLVSVRADLNYQQGLRRHWSRSTRYDFYFPAFAMLGEQSILNKEIYVRGDANDALVFGYQERWAEYRYLPSEITGLFRSTAASTIDPWHLAQKFTALPTLNSTFIEDNPPLDRIIAVGSAAAGKQLLLDCFFDVQAARPLPLYSVPGMIDHF